MTACGCDLETGRPTGQQSAAGPAGDDKNTNTIMLRLFPGDNNVEMSRLYKEHSEKDAHWKNLFVVKDDGYSTLYWGTYPNEQAAAGNLARARAYKTPTGEQVYKGARVTPIPGKELLGPPQWNLVKAPGEFSVLVAIFRNEPREDYWNMRQDAVKYCTSLRDHGYEAYYIHNSAESDVTVGCFDKSAIQVVNEGESPNSTVKTVIQDERINAILRDEQFKYLPLNGQQDIQTVVNAVTKTAEKIVAKPRVIRIPSKNDFGDLPEGMVELHRRPNP
jgi:hypothetical protein